MNGHIKKFSQVVLITFLPAGCDVKPPPASPPEPAAPSVPAAPSSPKPVELGRRDSPRARYLAGGGGEFRIEDLRGRPALLALLGAGTYDLKRVVAKLNRLQAEGVVLVGLLAAVAPEEDPVRLASDLGAGFPIVEATAPLLSAIGNPRALPSYILVDAEGLPKKVVQGAASEGELRELWRMAAAGDH